jgi:acyl phosphate:glycerol-3-phosphate acyltransferase
MSLEFIVLLILAYLSGSAPWSVWLGRLFFQADVRAIADGNPGAANAYRVGGWRLGAVVLLLDFFKAFIPVFIARWILEFSGDQLFWIGLMPTLGHAFSIFLGFRGGRALATFFGAWAGLTLYEVPGVMGATAIIASLLFKNDLLRSLAIPLILIAYLLLMGEPFWMLALGIAQLLVLLSKLIPFYLANQAAKP